MIDTEISSQVNINDLFNITNILRSKEIIPLNIYEVKTDDPTMILLIPSASICFRAPGGHLLDYLVLVEEEPGPNLMIGT